MINFLNKIIVSMLVIVLIAVMFVFQPSIAFACSCVSGISQEESFEQAKTVFAGEVVSVKKGGGFLYNLFKNKPSYNEVTFKVSEKWKGDNTDTVVVATAKSEASCGFDFEEGEKYIVYAINDSFYGAEFSTNICLCTQMFEKVDEEIDILGLGYTVLLDVETGEPNDHKWDSYENKKLGFTVAYPFDISEPYEARHPDIGLSGADTVRFLGNENHKIISIWIQGTGARDIDEWFKIAHGDGGYIITTTTIIAGRKAISIREEPQGKALDSYNLRFIEKGNAYSLYISDTILSSEDVEYITNSFHFKTWFEKIIDLFMK